MILGVVWLFCLARQSGIILKDPVASPGRLVMAHSDLVQSSLDRSSPRGAASPPNKGKRPIDPGILAALSDPSQVLFLDIESTGLSRYYDQLTLVGWLIDGDYQVHIAGDHPGALASALMASSALVTFNGTLFDLPFLSKTFPDLDTPKVHVDLRFLARRAGLTGGQKAIETELGIDVRTGVEDVDGAHAVLLWHRYLRGDLGSLRHLIDYNRSDVVAMRHILDEVLERLVSQPDLWFETSKFAQRHYTVSGWADPEKPLPPASRLDRPENTFLSLFAGSAAEDATIVGIDLTGSEARPSGWCELRGSEAKTEMVAKDEEMISRILEVSPAVVSIDSPLSIPFGRSRVEDDDPARDEFGIMRQCERELKRRGINVYPCLLPSMQGLTRRGMCLAAKLRALGVPVIESYPGAAQDIMGIPRKGAGEAFLKQGLGDFGVSGDFLTQPVRHDELDAITSALVGSFFLAGKFEPLAGPSEDALIIPDLEATLGPIVIGISGRICAGKTTAARALEEAGFAYTRFSLVVDDEIRRMGGEPDREWRQRVGSKINEDFGQRWLCERVLDRVEKSSMIVVDGLRFLEDRAFFIERFGSRFLHLHVTAPQRLRSQRYDNGSDSATSFDDAESQPVEREVDLLGEAASVSVENAVSIDSLNETIGNIVQEFVRGVGEQCQSRSS